jgi:hypothetical protein
MEKRSSLTGILLLLSAGLLYSQTIINPNYSLKSHETLQIIKVELKPEATIFYMSIENRIVGGSFCADKNIYVIYPDGKKIRLESASGIPVCPESHKFRLPGEKFDFVLTFPPLRKGIELIDLVEDCSDNCFSFFGIILDNTLNSRIDDAFALVENDEPVKSLISFISIAEEIDKKGQDIPPLLYINIIKLATENGDGTKAEEWYRKFRLSDSPRLSQYIKYLNDQGIKY